MENQKHLFRLPEHIHYMNCAFMAPVLHSSYAALTALRGPWQIKPNNWFEPVTELRSLYAQIIGIDSPDRIAITPSCSYGIANAVKQIKPTRGSNIVVAKGQFPSNYYAWKRLCSDQGCELREIAPPEGHKDRGKRWNESILNAIDKNTAVVAIAPLFHADGTLFDLAKIRQQTKAVNTLLIVDGTQAIGAFPLDMSVIQPDALICANYKWLLGPYGTGMAWYHDFFDEGIPVEENFIIHEGSEDFNNLCDYNDTLRFTGMRYSSGEHAAFLHIDLLLASAKQILQWTPADISSYTKQLFETHQEEFESLGCLIEEEQYRAPHLFGIRFSGSKPLNGLKADLDANNVYASVRADALRVSLHVFNTEEDILKLLYCIKKYVQL